MLFPVLETKCPDNGKGGAATSTGAGHGSDGLTAPTAPTAPTAIVQKEKQELHNERAGVLPTKEGRMDRGCNQSFVNKMAMIRTNSASKRKIECAASGVAFSIAGPRYGDVARVGGAGAAAGLNPSMNDEIEGKDTFPDLLIFVDDRIFFSSKFTIILNQIFDLINSCFPSKTIAQSFFS
jgi:hypothetical protein